MTAEECFTKGSSLYELWNRNEDENCLREALKYLTMAIELKPEYADACHKRARVYRSYRVFISSDEIKGLDQDLTRALHIYQEMLQLNQSYPEVHYKLGLVYRDLKDWRKSLFHLRKALNLDPAYVEVWAEIGDIYSWEKRCYKKALEYYNRAVELDGSIADYYLGRGKCFEGLRQYQCALRDYTMGMALESDNWSFSNMRGELYLKLQMWDEAIRDYTVFRTVEPPPHRPFLGFRQGIRGGHNFELYIAESEPHVTPWDPDSWCIDDMVFVEFVKYFSTTRKHFNHYGPTNIYSGRELKRIHRKLEEHLKRLETIGGYNDFFSHVIETNLVYTLIREFDDLKNTWPELLELMKAANRRLLSRVCEAESRRDRLFIEGI